MCYSNQMRNINNEFSSYWVLGTMVLVPCPAAKPENVTCPEWDLANGAKQMVLVLLLYLCCCTSAVVLVPCHCPMPSQHRQVRHQVPGLPCRHVCKRCQPGASPVKRHHQRHPRGAVLLQPGTCCHTASCATYIVHHVRQRRTTGHELCDQQLLLPVHVGGHQHHAAVPILPGGCRMHEQQHRHWYAHAFTYPAVCHCSLHCHHTAQANASSSSSNLGLILGLAIGLGGGLLLLAAAVAGFLLYRRRAATGKGASLSDPFAKGADLDDDLHSA